MNIPLDRLYHFIDSVASKIYRNPLVIYRFWPHGSKNIEDLNTLITSSDWYTQSTKLQIWCNDQEPLAHEYYSKHVRNITSAWQKCIASIDLYVPLKNLNWRRNVFQKNILLHSEQRSPEVKKYLTDGNLTPVYYWSHAIISRDWFRYAKHETFKKNITKRFLIYNRAWTGTREYRLKFTDMLVANSLVDQCQSSCNPVESGKHYQTHTFKNPAWRPLNILENHFKPVDVDSSSSADFCTGDYESTCVEVVLETLFDDDRLHLTEKSLRPIACGQPFILAATQGSLAYLRSYGFRTFDTVWDESYDMIEDPYDRMQAIIEIMKVISTWNENQLQEKLQSMHEITTYNKQHFFSEDFFDLIVNELQTNLSVAFYNIKAEPGFDKWISAWQRLLQFGTVQDFLNYNQDLALPTKKQYQDILDFIKQYPKTVANQNQI